MIIAIDGYTGTGKGSTAKGVAQALGYTLLDTGAMYRAVALYAINNNIIDADDKTLSDILGKVTMEFRWIGDAQHMFLDGVDIEKDIRNTALGEQMKPIVTCLPLREKMVTLQQSYGTQGNIVCDGRDIGTHVFPDAALKVFMTCDIDERVRRRVSQLTNIGLHADEKKIKEETLLRDNTDYLGNNAVNKQAVDARVLDTTNTTLEEQIHQIIDWHNEIINE